MPEKPKYSSQIKNLRKNYVRFPLDLKPDVLEKFKEKCAANNTAKNNHYGSFIIPQITDKPTIFRWV